MPHEIAGHQIAWCQGEEPEIGGTFDRHAAILTSGRQLLAATVLEDDAAVDDARTHDGQLAGPHGVVHVENGGTLWCVQIAAYSARGHEVIDALGAITAAGPWEALVHYLAEQYPLVAPELHT